MSQAKVYATSDSPDKSRDEGEEAQLVDGVRGYNLRAGARVKALKGERNDSEYFPATVVSHFGGKLVLRYDDFKGNEKVNEADTRPLIEKKSYPNTEFRLAFNNVNEFEHQVFYRALRRGKAGLKFITFNKVHGKDLKGKDDASICTEISKLIDSDTNFKETDSQQKADFQLLFAEILEMCSYEDFVRYKLEGSYDSISMCLQLFYCARNASIRRLKEKEELDFNLLQEKGCFTSFSSKSSFNILDGIREMLQGNYILESWRTSADASDAYNDVVSMNQNLGLIAALILTIAIPQGLNANGITDKSSGAEIAYLFCISVVSLTEGLAVLITTRNLIALNALDPENIKPYLSVAQSVLLMPIRLNFVAVLALFAALNLWAVAQNGIWLWLGFFLLIVCPTLFVFLRTTGAGIMHLYTVQPWRSRKKKKTPSQEVVDKSTSPKK